MPTRRQRLITGLMMRDGFFCMYCRKTWTIPFSRDITVDHIHPISKGGNRKYRLKNCFLSCRKCNEKKANKVLSLDQLLKIYVMDEPIQF